MAFNLSYYDWTQLAYVSDPNDDGAIPQSDSGSSSWISLMRGMKKFKPSIGESRFQHYGNSQVVQVDQRDKRWFDFELEYILSKYESGTPAWDWWDIVNKAFYGGATGAPANRPGTIWLGAKLNRATPEYWIAAGCKIEQVVLKGDMKKDAVSLNLKGSGRTFNFGTTNFVQGTSAVRAEPATDYIVPSKDVTITIGGNDDSNLIDTWTLTLKRVYQKRGRSSTISGSGTQIGIDGTNYREFTPETFEGKFQATIDQAKLTSDRMLDYFNDAALSSMAFEIQCQNTTNGKKIQFTSAKQNKADTQFEEKKSPSQIDIDILGSSINVATI